MFEMSERGRNQRVGCLKSVGHQDSPLSAQGSFSTLILDPAAQFHAVPPELLVRRYFHNQPLQQNGLVRVDWAAETHPELKTDHGRGPGIVGRCQPKQKRCCMSSAGDRPTV